MVLTKITSSTSVTQISPGDQCASRPVEAAKKLFQSRSRLSQKRLQRNGEGVVRKDFDYKGSAIKSPNFMTSPKSTKDDYSSEMRSISSNSSLPN